MHMSGVDVPTHLIEAHESGDLIIFVGAGASIPWPSSLPSFLQLVKTIRDESNLQSEIGALDDQPLDEVLGTIADDYGVDVHERIHHLTSRTGSRPSPVHKAVVKLASASTTRIVTTNYDHHLSTSLDELHEDVDEYFAPALPMGDDFSGIVCRENRHHRRRGSCLHCRSGAHDPTHR
jgi:hypothetical protein